MMYKVGDRVKIKTWEQMKKEYGLKTSQKIDCDAIFTKGMEQFLKSLNSNRVVTIALLGKKHANCYYMLESKDEFFWSEDMISGLAPSIQKTDNTEEKLNRYEIIDL